jgi:alpha-amylase
MNKTLIQFFDWYCSADGTHWNRFAKEAQRLPELGITAAWLPPAYKGTKGAASEGYDVYDIYDLGEFDQKGSVCTKYGTRQAYVEAIKTARAAGLKVIVDIVLNHMGGAEETERIKVKKVDPENRNNFTSEEMEIEAYTKFTFPGRNGKYSNFIWDHQCFTGIDYAADLKENAIFSILNEYGDDWEPLSHDEKGNFDYLILNDIETRNPAVREELKRWIKWYYETVPFDGIRLDAVKHINPSFFMEWLDYIAENITADIFVLGEFWLSDDLEVLLNYIEVTRERMSLFDAPLHHNFSEASVAGDRYDLRSIFDSTLVRERPDLAVTFVDNHDTQPLQSLEEYTEQWFKPHAYAMILLREQGYPCVFFADLYGSCYSGKNKAGEEKQVEIPKLECLPALLQLRKEKNYGKQLDYFEHHNCIGWVRQGSVEKPSSGFAVVLNTHSAEPLSIRMHIGENFPGKIMTDALGNCAGKVFPDENGFAEFPSTPGKISVWIAE